MVQLLAPTLDSSTPRRSRGRPTRHVDVTDLLTRDGIVDLRREGTANRRRIRRAHRQGRLARIARGLYLPPGRATPKAPAFRLHGALAGLSAASFYGWSLVLRPTTPHVAVPKGRKVSPRRRQGVHLHRRGLSRHELAIGITSPLNTLVDCVRALPFREALAVADSAVRTGMVHDLEARAALWALRGPGSRTAHRVADALSGLSANAFESALRAICLDVPRLRVSPQVYVAATGARVDLADEGLALAIEADSVEHHAGRDGFLRDVHRYTDLVAAGWTVVRFTWHDVMADPDRVRHILESVIAHRLSGRQDVPNGARDGGVTREVVRRPRSDPHYRREGAAQGSFGTSW